MLDTILSFFDELRRTVRIVDAVDVLLVSTFLYAALLWFQKTASRGVLIGVAALAVVYFLARGLDMYLTSMAFHTSFAVLLFILVVVFQEELRRLLERVSALRSVRIRRARETSADLDALVEAVFKMSAGKTGALIVFKGTEPLARHLHGGIALNGRISQPLLFSIFDPHTPGHDGAMIIERDQVTEFAAHLPISRNTKVIAGRGTRHSAALGLSECSDALTVVVSEESGIVSVAEYGKLAPMPTAADLKKRLTKFFAAKFPPITQSFWNRFLIQNLHLKVLALVIAIVAWFVLAYDPHTIQRTFVVPIEYRNLTPQLELDGTEPSEARVTLSGSERNFRFLDPGSLKITLDMTDAVAGYQEIQLSDRNIRLPANVSTYRIEPRIIPLFLNVKTPVETPPPEPAAEAAPR